MPATMPPKGCPKCRKPMEPIPIGSNPKASEFYCAHCHHSVLMGEEEYGFWMEQKQMVERAARQGMQR